MPPPRPEWLMTDERMGEALWTALRRLPPGAGVVFRHYATPPATRARLLMRVRRIATARRLRLVVGHAPGGHGGIRPVSWPAHDRAEALKGAARRARRLFVSPVFATRSHPGTAGLGVMRAARVAQGLGEVVALGGMNARAWRRISRFGFAGWAGIDAWMG